MKDYTDYILDQTKKLLDIDSPSGYTHEVISYVEDQLTSMGYKPTHTNKGGLMVALGGENKEDGLLLQAHVDTIGGIVAEVKNNGCLRIDKIGGLNPNAAEAENVRVYTRNKQVYEGTCQLLNPSTHVNNVHGDTKRTYETLEIVLDEFVETKQETEALGIKVGDYVCFEPRFRVTKQGFIKGRFLDNKLSAAVALAYAKYLKDEQVTPQRAVYIHFTVFEEVSHGGSASVPEGTTEVLAFDMGCVGKGLNGSERKLSICVKDAFGPYNYDMVSGLIEAAEQAEVDYVLDVYPHYGSDADMAIRAGHDVRHGLIGPGVYASHGYERSHIKAAMATFETVKHYVK